MTIEQACYDLADHALNGVRGATQDDLLLMSSALREVCETILSEIEGRAVKAKANNDEEQR